VVAWPILGHKLSGEVFADWRKAQIDESLRSTLALLEKITLSPREIDAHDIAELRRTGLTDRAILDATYVCVGFNIIARIAEALGFDIPSDELFSRAAKLLRVFGYKRLSGFWTSKRTSSLAKPLLMSVGPQREHDATTAATSFDPHATKMTRLHHAVTSSPASLPAVVRQTITAGRNVSGPLGAYVRKIAEHAHEITDEDIASLRAANYTDDEIFEATVSAALGAGLFRLDCVLRALVASQATIIAQSRQRPSSSRHASL
jgi:alkylhydroperoxidase family enzyme